MSKKQKKKVLTKKKINIVKPKTKDLDIKNTLKISYKMIGFIEKKKKKKKTTMKDIFDNVKNNKKINLPNTDQNDMDHNEVREKQLFSKLLKQEHYNTATSYTFLNKW